MKIYRIRFSGKNAEDKDAPQPHVRNWRHNMTWQIVAESMLDGIAKMTAKAAKSFVEIELHMVEYLGEVNVS